MFHTFLLDENNNIILVGDPVESMEIKELLKDIINRTITKN